MLPDGVESDVVVIDRAGKLLARTDGEDVR